MNFVNLYNTLFGRNAYKGGTSPDKRRSSLNVEGLEERRTPAVSQLPDLTTWADQGRGFLSDWYLDTSTTAGRTLLRLSNSVANVGTGPLEIRGGQVNTNGTQAVSQRIYDDTGAFFDRPAGSFVYHAEHGHVHFEDFAQYNLRAVTAGDGVGSVIASGAKTSYRLEDTTVYNSSLPGYSSTRGYYGGGQIQGISVGWADYYHRSLAGQWIDVTNVAAGTYWLESVADPLNRIAESNENNNAARIKITIGNASAPDYAGNTPATARDIGTLASNQAFQDFVSPSDKNDYYRFTLSAQSNFALRMDGLTSDADVYLLNSSGTTIGRSTAGGVNPEAITQSLAAGTYYVRVYLYGNASTPYSLNLSAGGATADGAGNTLGTARDIGDITGSQTFGDLVATADQNDYYRFRATGSSDVNFNLRLDNLTGDAGVQLLDDNGAVIASSTNAGNTNESINATLHGGNAYFIRVFLQSGTTASYRLTTSGSVATTPDGAGNTLQAARDLGALTTSQNIQDFVGTSDTNDYYRFTLAASATVSLRLDGLSENADVQLLGSNSAVLASSVNIGTTADIVSRLLNAGTYYVRVYPNGNAHSNYTLVLSSVLAPTPPPPTTDAGNTMQTARDIGALTGNLSFQDSVSPTDTNDYYRFTLGNAATLNLRMDGLAADADVQLFNSSGSSIAYSNNWGTTVESINRQLAAGTYYIRVYPYGSITTNYNLSLTLA